MSDSFDNLSARTAAIEQRLSALEHSKTDKIETATIGQRLSTVEHSKSDKADLLGLDKRTGSIENKITMRWPGLSEQRFGSDRWFPRPLSPSIAAVGRRVGRA